jgi:tetratricopeptide (TPR) repeat protein
MLAQAQGEYAEARRLYQESLDIRQQLGDRAGVATTLAQLALLEEAENSVPRALELIRQAEAAFTELRSPYADQARRDRERLETKSRSDDV